ncbi:carboxylesterase family protein [Streptomyces sp. NPDC007164]|uniref:carboxylesterase family protein n=1 Tax=Streptomyces sp. NPDC007164 TaxID=3156918 RepID=UPI00340851AC
MARRRRRPRHGHPLRHCGALRRFPPPRRPRRTLQRTRLVADVPQPADPIADTMFGVDPRALPTDEHCQHLSITMPAQSSPALLPVMVWIHGGGYATGSGDLAAMDPATLVAEQDVVVTVTYRLGLLGFIQSESGPKANLGLPDQREAFRWIRRNISAFGGDPHNVTAFGQSAGAAALVDLMATENAASLFTRAIIQSAPLGIMRGRERLNRAVSRRANAIRATTPIAAVADVQADVIRAGAPFGLKSGMPSLRGTDIRPSRRSTMSTPHGGRRLPASMCSLAAPPKKRDCSSRFSPGRPAGSGCLSSAASSNAASWPSAPGRCIRGELASSPDVTAGQADG